MCNEVSQGKREALAEICEPSEGERLKRAGR